MKIIKIMGQKLPDQLILEQLYEDIRNDHGLVAINLNEDFKRFFKKAIPYVAAAGMASTAPDAKGSSRDLEDYNVNKTKQFSSMSPSAFYKKAKEQEKAGTVSNNVTVEKFTKSIKNYLIKKLDGIEELKSSEDVYVDILNIFDRNDGSVMVTVEVTGKIFASSQTSADKKAEYLIKKVLEESNISIEALTPLYAESSEKEYKYQVRANIIIK